VEGSKGIIFYTDNKLNLHIAHKVQRQLKSIGLPIVSASLKPMSFGKNIWMKGFKRSYMSMFKQILTALEHSDSEIIYFCEHDVLYSRSHFDFTPPSKDVWYYNVNVYKLNADTGHAIKTDDCRQVSGICVYRDLAIKHYKKRLQLLENKISEIEHYDDAKFQNKEDIGKKAEDTTQFNSYIRSIGFEPATHNRLERVDDSKSETWSSPEPIVDIRHDGNLTSTRWRPEQFRNQKFTEGWQETDELPYWGKIKI
jgi:hypothetical protein